MRTDLHEVTFIMSFNALAQRALETAKSKGWYDDGERNKAEQIALMHSELSEALEAARHGDPPDDKIPEFTGQEAELGDTIIRIMNYAAEHKLRVGEAIVAKMLFNTTRAHKHGGKLF
jgi:NTP pyrophosphatase (non-canonical NTP hydrolase)